MPERGSIPYMGAANWENLPPGQPGQVLKLPEGGGDPVWVDLPSLSVGGGLTDTELRAAPVPVTGTVSVGNFPATQPVSGTFWPATQPVSGTVAVSNFPASQAVTGTFWQATQPVSGTVTANVGTVPTLTKGTQGSTGYSTQDLKDAGRVLKTFRAINFSTATTEALITLTPCADGTDAATGTSFGVTSGKRLRLTGLTLTTRNAGAAIQAPIVKVRMTASGAVGTSSPVIAEVACQSPAATANHVGYASFTFPDGVELSGTMQVGISQLGIGAVAGNDVVLLAYEY